MQALTSIAKVVVELPLESPLDYFIPAPLRAVCHVGCRVLVPLGHRQVLGYVVEVTDTSTVSSPKPLTDVLDTTPLLTPELLYLTQWIAHYYMCSWGQVLKAAVPEGFRACSTNSSGVGSSECSAYRPEALERLGPALSCHRRHDIVAHLATLRTFGTFGTFRHVRSL